MNLKMRKQRYLDFQRRVKQDPGSILTHRDSSWEYIPVQTFADDSVDLKRMGIVAADCISVDACWLTHDDAVLLQVRTRKCDVAREPGLYVCKDTSEFHWLTLYAVLNSNTITRTSFEEIMTQFVGQGLPDGDLFRGCSEELTRI